ncbi:MAG: SDR family NAD(P)-dependent oxidoreductase [Flavobacteriales bacterium]|nr:SDR family NAD(P)-dependent oxidoreductase [Flavobacteriales bacterium]
MEQTPAARLSASYPLKRAFITGAASGLGLALCEELAREGWVIGMADISAEKLNLSAEGVHRLGGTADIHQLDVADKDAYRKVAENFLTGHGGIDLLVNNAGVGDAGYVEDYGLENWDWLLGINLHGVIYGSALFIPTMRAQRSGTIINIASAAAFTSLPRMGAYNVSKAAVLSLSETMSAELHHHGVHVSVVMPTFFKTAVMQHSRGKAEHIEMSRLIFGTSTLTPEEVAARVLHQAARGRFHIVLPWDARFMYRLKRYFPNFMLRLFRLSEKHTDVVQARLRKKFERMERSGKVDHGYLERVFGGNRQV